MERRDFLKGSAVAAAGATLSSAQTAGRQFSIENEALVWHFEAGENGVRSTGFENRLTGTNVAVETTREFELTFQAAGRVEIPWWSFRLTDAGSVNEAEESGLRNGYHRPQTAAQGWRFVRNLAGGQSGRRYGGYGWFRCEFPLQEAAKGKPVVLVLGGYDEQDWNERWIYLNGEAAAHSTASGRWRSPGKYVVNPGDAAYASLRFGGESKNVLAVRCRGYDYHVIGLPEKAVERYVFRPFLFDQFVSYGEPYRKPSGWELSDVRQDARNQIVFQLRDTAARMGVSLHYSLDGRFRRKWLEVTNTGDSEQLLLDVVLDDFRAAGGRATPGGHGEPVFLNENAFFAIEHPAGINQGESDRIRLWHCPGRTIGAGERLTSRTAVAGVAEDGQALRGFHHYLEARSPRRKKGRVSIYTSYGINNQWGGCGTLADQEVLNCQEVVRKWQQKGVKLDFFTLDTGWPQNDGDLTEFTATCFPDGPDQVVDGIHKLGMKFGLWFSVSWGGWANGSYPGVQASAIPDPGTSGEPPAAPPVTAYRNGYPISGGVGRQMCIASEPFFNVFRNAVVHHIRHSQARLVKFDSGNYYCNSTAHGHLPGKYSTEAMFDHLIAIARAAREAAPDIFVTWYWGAGSPFWALHGDIIAESGLFMEGSGTSWVPTLYYRDGVTLSLDQNTQFANLIPATNKDSLGVWLSQIRWANFMGKERWREALIMDFGRGSMVFPQLWGDPNLLSDEDVEFLARIMAIAKENEALFLGERRLLGDSWNNEPYGYAFFDGAHGFVFCSNAHFASRKVRLPLGPALGLTAKSGLPLRITAHFPDRSELVPEDGSGVRAGDAPEFWMRPFETLLLEVGTRAQRGLPRRQISSDDARRLGQSLRLEQVERAQWMELRFADAARFDQAGMRPAAQCFSSRLPELGSGRSILAIVVTLSTESGQEFRYRPPVVEIVQLRCRVGGRIIQLVPVPDARRFGNTQSAGCSWVLYKVPLVRRHSGNPVEFAVHTYLPPGIRADVQAWVTRQWWVENSRPEADGYYGDAPS